MAIVKEYKNQKHWRNWISYIEKLPIKNSDTILDLGCATGDVTKLIADRCLNVIGIDFNDELIKEAEKTNFSHNIKYLNKNLRNINRHEVPIVDGIWTSFTIAYFPEFESVLNSWLDYVKPGGWIAITEMSDLFAHFPLNEKVRDTFKKYYQQQLKDNVYDFEMGIKLKQFLINKGLTILFEENKYDEELTFNGPANNEILTAWDNRFKRMVAFQDFCGKKRFAEIRTEFLECLKNQKHTSKTEVKFIIAKK